jgi:hypothetical protein
LLFKDIYLSKFFSTNYKKNVKNVSFKNTYFKKAFLKLLSLNSIFNKPLYSLSLKKGSIDLIKYLLVYKPNNLLFQQNQQKNEILNLLKFSSTTPYSFFTPLFFVSKIKKNNAKNRSYTGLSLSSFYLNSLLQKKSGYSRSFSKNTKTKIFVTFKKFKNYSYFSSNLNLLNFSNVKLNDNYFVILIFNNLLNSLSSNLNYISFPYSLHTLYHSQKFNTPIVSSSSSLLLYKNIILNHHLNMNLNIFNNINLIFYKDSISCIDSLSLYKNLCFYNDNEFSSNFSSNSLM